MNLLVVGRGGREHSLVMELAKSKQADKIYCAPGNDGIAQHAECVAIDEMNTAELVTFAKENGVDLTIIGPEKPLNAGVANQFQDAGLAVFAPTKEAALLEGSKQFAKAFMDRHAIPTAAYASFVDAEAAKNYIREQGAPIVVKADGLAQGKGVIVAETEAEAIQAVDDMLVDHAFAEASSTIVIEECLTGKECSVMAFVHDGHVYPMLPARDHKRAYDGDKGSNTGGMGAYAPAADVTDDELAFTYKEILKRTADGLQKENRSFTGILYAGLMLTPNGPKVIEFNTRFGDPETQVVLPLLENDLLQVFLDCLAGRDPNLQWKDASCAGVVVAAKGYPNAYEKGISIPELKPEKTAFVAHAGTKKTGETYVSNGGRVLLVGSEGQTLADACKLAYETLKPIDETPDLFYRHDIGTDTP